MDETRPSMIKPKKMVSRNIALALGIICIILAAGLVTIFVYYNSSYFTSGYTRIVLPEGSGGVAYYFGKNEFTFYGACPSCHNSSQPVFRVEYPAEYTACQYAYNATLGATYDLLGIEIKVSEVHSDYIVLLAKSL
jgi:hypothetical protein